MLDRAPLPPAPDNSTAVCPGKLLRFPGQLFYDMANNAIVLGALFLHSCQVLWYPDAMNLRTSIAVTAFAACAAFADRFSDDWRYAVPLLRAFGLLGMVTVMTVLHFAARASV